MAPFFGFAFLKHEHRMPNKETRMVLPKGCAHNWERCTRDNDSKLAVFKWDCIVHFVNETKKFVRIKTSRAISQDSEIAKEFMFACSTDIENNFSSHNIVDDAISDGEIVQMTSESGYMINDYITQRSPSQGYNSSYSTDNDDDESNQVIDKFILEDKFFVNFDENTKTLRKIHHLNKKFAESLEKFNHLIVCEICEEHVDDNKVKIVEHLENHTALSIALPPEDDDDILPLFKLISSV